MYFKRNEAFRFQLEPPIMATFSINMIESDGLYLRKMDCYILDISPGGAKVEIYDDISLNFKEVSMEFFLGGEIIEIIGEIRWKRGFGNHCTYGIKFKKDSIDPTYVTKLIKQHRKIPVNS